MNDYTVTKNNFYCEICHTRFEKGKNAIGAHERSQKHIRAKEKATKWLMSRPKEKTEEQKYQEEVDYLNQRNQSRYSGAPPPTKQPGGKGDKHGQAGGPGESGYGTRKDQKEPPQPLPSQELGLSLKDTASFVPGSNMFAGVWTLRKEEETGKLCFYNMKSGIKHFERPRGVKLSAADEKKWEEYQSNPTKSVDIILDPTVAEGTVGQWEEVDVAEDYYANNALDSADEIPVEEPEDEEDLKIEEQLEKFNEMNEDERNELLDLEKPEEGKSILRSKTDKLKKYIDADIEMVSKPTFQKESDILFKRNLENRGFDGTEGGEPGTGNNLFKKKKVQGNKRVILGFDNENEIE